MHRMFPKPLLLELFFKEKAQIAVINVITFEKRGQLRRHVYEGTIANHSSC